MSIESMAIARVIDTSFHCGLNGNMVKCLSTTLFILKFMRAIIIRIFQSVELCMAVR